MNDRYTDRWWRVALKLLFYEYFKCNIAISTKCMNDVQSLRFSPQLYSVLIYASYINYKKF